MARINLLPWREELRKERQKQFFVTVGIAVAITLGIWGVVHYHHVLLIEEQQARNTYLETEIAKLDKKIKEISKLEKQRRSLIARMRAIERLQKNRPLVVRLFDEIVTNLPDGVSILSINQQGKKVTIKGVAESNARVSSFMKNIEGEDSTTDKWITKPELEIIQAKDEKGKRISNFTLRFTQVIPKAEEEEGA